MAAVARPPAPSLAPLPAGGRGESEVAALPWGWGWTSWSRFEVRSAGFSTDRLARLASPETWALALRRAGLRADVAVARAALTEALRAARAQAGEATPFNRALRALGRGKAPELPPGATPALQALVDELAARRASLREADEALSTAFAQARRHATAAAYAELFEDDLGRALLWQNPDAWRGALAAWKRRGPEATDNASRKAERLVVSYLQRYAAKNDTVGFFGPVAFGGVRGDDDGVTGAPGPGLVRSCRVHLEPWAAAALADALALDEELRPHLRLRASPRARVEGGGLFTTRARSLRLVRALSPDEVRAFAAAEAGRTLADVLEEEPGLRPALDQLLEGSVVRLELPVELGPTPERTLLEVLEAPGAPPAFSTAAAKVRAVLTARDRAASAPDAPALDEALREVDQTFAAVVKTRARRRPGETYAARTPVYLNCLRDVEVEVGGGLWRRVGPPLTLLLHSARWFTAEVARRFAALCTSHLDDLARRTGQARVPLPLLYERLIPAFAPPGASFLKEVRADLQARWDTVLGPLDDDAAEVHLEAAELRPKVERVFAADAPGWPCARHHSPDLLFAKRPEGFIPVLGEIHAGLNTLGVLQAVTQCPAPDVLRRAFAKDIDGPLVSEIPWDGYGLALQDFLHTARDFHLDTGARWTSPWGPHRTLALRDLDAVRDDAGWRVRSRDAGVDLDVIHVLERIIRLNATMEFHPFAGRGPAPRVWIDGLVVARRRFVLEGADLQRFLAADGSNAMAVAAELAHKGGWPRHLFVRLASEPKPVFLDLASPPSLDVVRHVARKADRLHLSEMLPSPDEAWLGDAAGRRYVSELRVVATDPCPAASPGAAGAG